MELTLLTVPACPHAAAPPAESSGAVAPYPPLFGAMSHNPKTSAAYSTTTRHTRTRNHDLIPDASHTVISLRAKNVFGIMA